MTLFVAEAAAGTRAMLPLQCTVGKRSHCLRPICSSADDHIFIISARSGVVVVAIKAKMLIMCSFCCCRLNKTKKQTARLDDAVTKKKKARHHGICCPSPELLKSQPDKSLFVGDAALCRF